MSLGHTNYHHLGADCPAARTPNVRSTPYYLYGAQRRYPYAWHGGAGGVPQQAQAAEVRALSGGCFPTPIGNADILESGLNPYTLPYPSFKRTHLHDPTLLSQLSDWPLVRPAGPEPLDPHEGAPRALGFSDNEKRLGLVLAAAAIGYFAYKKLRKKPNPIRGRYVVIASARRDRPANYAGSFTTKKAASAYAAWVRRGGGKASVRRK
jgi:hypothetical protein